MAMFREIASTALSIEPDHERVWRWMLEEPIAELDGKTVVELVWEGRGRRVIDMLDAVKSGLRGL
ncbi:hypothetical protein ACVWWQ_002763 [Rhodanobacter sp. TND4EL1]